ncbi:hypothetical protein QVD17_00128 [Tagetes erecta]|uniref:Uncharacterized protein n=1 Tax=Tagetes erecta TaxID=13708 RepID=A0AAD8P5K5_TARER|nr:hypothetical protein QVD17_00128 [Tagetes erecta]
MKFELKHNVAAYLNEDFVEAAGYEEIISFFLRTKYVYVMRAKLIIYERLIKKFRRIAEVVEDDNGQKVDENSEPIDPNDLEHKDPEDELSESESENESDQIDEEENDDESELSDSESESDDNNSSDVDDVEQEQNLDDIIVNKGVEEHVQNDVIIEADVDVQVENLADNDLYLDMDIFQDDNVIVEDDEVLEAVVQLQNVEVEAVDVIEVIKETSLEITKVVDVIDQSVGEAEKLDQKMMEKAEGGNIDLIATRASGGAIGNVRNASFMPEFADDFNFDIDL